MPLTLRTYPNRNHYCALLCYLDSGCFTGEDSWSARIRDLRQVKVSEAWFNYARDAYPNILSLLTQHFLSLQQFFIADRSQGKIKCLSVVPTVIDTSRGCLVRKFVRFNEILLSQIYAIYFECLGNNIESSLEDEKMVLSPESSIRTCGALIGEDSIPFPFYVRNIVA